MACHAFKFWDNQKACLAMVFMQLLYAGMALLSKAALNKGMSYFVFVVYRQAIATLALTPFVCIYERRKAPPMSLIIFCKIFLLALVGLTLSMDLYYMALRYTSATFATTIINIIPAMTFLIAILLRIESINLRRTYGRLKIVGMLICIGGAVLLSLYQGPPLKLLNWHHNVAPPSGRGVLISHGEDKPMTLKGPLLMFAAFTTWSIWFVMQAEILKDYPAKIQLTALQCFLSTIQSAITALVLDRNIDSWKLGWNIQLLSVVYCGIFVSGVSYWLQIWCIEKKGPVYVAMFSPLSVPITAILSALWWAELIYFGSVVGGLLIVGGLYCVLWGKSKEVENGSLENVIVPSGTPKDKLADLERG